MESKVNYTTVGLFVVLLTAALVIAAYWLSNGDHQKYNSYLVFMNEAVSGLSQDAAVKFNGVDVGYVDKISLNPKNPQQVRLVLNITEGTPITESTTATLMAQGVTGITYIGLKARKADSPLLRAKPGEPYPVIPAAPSLLVELDTALRVVTTNVKSVAQVFNQLFDNQNRAAIKSTLLNIQQFSQVLADNSKQVDASIKNADKLLSNSAQASANLPKMTQQLQSTLTAMNKSTQALAAATQASQVAIENVTQQTLPDVFQSISRLTSVLTNLEQFTNQLQNNPSVLIRGAKPATLGPGEK